MLEKKKKGVAKMLENDRIPMIFLIENTHGFREITFWENKVVRGNKYIPFAKLDAVIKNEVSMQ